MLPSLLLFIGKAKLSLLSDEAATPQVFLVSLEPPVETVTIKLRLVKQVSKQVSKVQEVKKHSSTSHKHNVSISNADLNHEKKKC